MSEYCSKCSPFENDYDIDLAEIALKLDDERSVNIFCEGLIVFGCIELK